MKWRGTRITGVLLLTLSAVYLTGSFTFLSPCGPKEDGSWMTCHWAGQALIGLAILLTIFSLVHLFVPSLKMKTGLSMAIFPTSILAALLPGNIISICSMATMHCHLVTKPGAMVFGILLALISAADILTNWRKS